MTQLRAIQQWYSLREGMVTMEDDVLSIVRQVRQLYGDRVTIEADERMGAYHFVEHCEDGTDRLIFTTETLDGRCIERLLQADSHARGHVDLYDAAEREQDELHAKIDEQYADKLRQYGESLAHALKKDGVMPRLPQQVAIPRGLDA